MPCKNCATIFARYFSTLDTVYISSSVELLLIISQAWQERRLFVSYSRIFQGNKTLSFQCLYSNSVTDYGLFVYSLQMTEMGDK
jgi:hypothetical protein